MGFDSSGLEDKMDSASPGTIVDTLDNTKTRDCWGDENGTAVFEGINASLWIGCGAIPLIWLVIIIVLFVRFGTPAAHKATVRMLLLPYFLVKDFKGTCRILCHRKSPCSKGYSCS